MSRLEVLWQKTRKQKLSDRSFRCLNKQVAQALGRRRAPVGSQSSLGQEKLVQYRPARGARPTATTTTRSRVDRGSHRSLNTSRKQNGSQSRPSNSATCSQACCLQAVRWKKRLCQQPARTSWMPRAGVVCLSWPHLTASRTCQRRSSDNQKSGGVSCGAKLSP